MADPFESLLVRFAAPRGGHVLTIPPPTDLRFDGGWSGGPKSMSCTLLLPQGSALPAALMRFARVDVVDRRTGRVVWHGKLTDPGLSTEDGALRCSLTAEGGQIDMDGWREVYGLVDRAKESWQAVGEFDAAQASFGGGLAPGGDYDFNLGDYGDLIDFGDELSIDFGSDLDLQDLDLGDLGDFGGDLDLNDLGQIDFTGGDYPSTADYPGYLGYLQDPLGELGDMLPIPMGGDPPGIGWIEGVTPPGGDSSGETETGTTLTTGTGPFIARRRSDDYATMIVDGTYDLDIDGFPVVASGTPDPIKTALAQFELGSSGAVAELWAWADGDVTNRGWFVRLDTSGTLGLYEVVSGTATLIASAAKSLSAGTLYEVRFNPNSFLVAVETAGTFPHDGSIVDWRWWNSWTDIDGFASVTLTELFSAVDVGDALYVAVGARGSSTTVTWSAFEIMRESDDPYPGD